MKTAVLQATSLQGKKTFPSPAILLDGNAGFVLGALDLTLSSNHRRLLPVLGE